MNTWKLVDILTIAERGRTSERPQELFQVKFILIRRLEMAHNPHQAFTRVVGENGQVTPPSM